MGNQKKQMILIKLPYWLGIGADALWAAGLFVPSIYGILTGNPDFNPDLQSRLLMGIGGSLMTGWTLLLIWAVRKPIERKTVILLTSLVVIGLFIVALVGFLDGNNFNIWILIKNTILLVTMISSYLLAGKMERKNYSIN